MTEDLAHPTDAVASYLTGQIHPSQTALLAAYAVESAATIEALRPALDLRYGPHPRELFDTYEAAGPSQGLLVYYHGGYWQARGKEQFRFLASAFLAQGIDVAFVNYPLCPDVPLRTLVEAARTSIPAIYARMRDRGSRPMVVAGHSAGAHLAVELALTDWSSYGLTPQPIAGVLPISGVYELSPLLGTPLNDKLRLNPEEAKAMSPLRRASGPLPPAAFIVGSLETPAFHAQSEQMHEAWLAAGGTSQIVVAPGADHYSMLRQLAPGHAAFEVALGLFAAPV